MNPNERIIKIKDKKVYLTKDYCVDFSRTSFHNKTLTFSPRKEIFWKAEVTYDKTNNSIRLEIIDYNPGNKEQFEEQILKKEIDNVVFNKLKWQELEPLLSSYKEITLQDLVEKLPQYSSPSSPDNKILSENILSGKALNKQSTENRLLEIESYKEEIITERNEPFKAKIKFTKAIFQDDGVSINRFTTDYGLKIDFDLFIENPNIQAEFDSIKYFFHKIFKSRYFNIEGILKYRNDELISIEDVLSDEIQSIDDTIIESVKDIQVALIPKLREDTDKEKKLFTLSEIIELLKEGQKDAKILIDKEGEIIDRLLKSKSNSGNRQQLLFLSGAIQDEKDKIKFTLDPKFGFLFSFNRESKKHYCWELLESHATYLWSFDNELTSEKQYHKVEAAINFIIDNGRNNYKKAYKQELFDNDITFNVIQHTTSVTSDNNRFIHWKNKFLSLISDDKSVEKTQ